MYFTGCLIVLPDAALVDGRLMELSVVGTQLTDNPVMSVGLGIWITTDATGVYGMVLWESCLGTGMLGDVSVRLVTRNDIAEQFFKLNEYRLPHDTHYRRIPQGSISLNIIWQLDFSPMVLLMAFRTQRDEVIGCIPTCLSTLDMVGM